MKPNPLSPPNHLTVPVAIVFPPALIVLRTRRLLSKGYERWHCDVGQITQPDLPTVAAAGTGARLEPEQWIRRPSVSPRAQASAPAGSTKRIGVRGSVSPERPRRGPRRPRRGAS